MRSPLRNLAEDVAQEVFALLVSGQIDDAVRIVCDRHFGNANDNGPAAENQLAIVETIYAYVASDAPMHCRMPAVECMPPDTVATSPIVPPSHGGPIPPQLLSKDY